MLFLSLFQVTWVVSFFGKGNPFRVEGLFRGYEEKEGVASGTIMLVLGHLEGKE